MKTNSKASRADAERATVHYAVHCHSCVIVRRAIRTQFQSVDFFASDVVGKRADGSHVYIQATAGQASAVSTRRKKLERIPWHSSDTVELVQLVQTPDPANARRTLWFFKVYQYAQYYKVGDKIYPGHTMDERSWRLLDTAVPIDRSWFKAYKEKE